MLKTYYIPKAEEFHIGFSFEKRPFYFENGTYGVYEPTEINHHAANLPYVLLELGKGKVRVRHLHTEDFIALGMNGKQLPVPAVGEKVEAYIFSANIKHPREIPVKMSIYYTPLTHWCMITFNEHCVFAGEVQNISELKKVLKQIKGDGIITKG